MPETIDTHKEIVKIRRDIEDIKRSQETNMQLTREKYEELVSKTLVGNETRVKAFLAVDGLRSRKEIQDVVGGAQPTVWRAIDYLESKGLIIKLDSTKRGSPIYAKPRWVHVLRMDDYVREHFSFQQEE